MKPTKMRNSQLYQATYTTRSAQLSSPLSNDLQKKFAKKSVRIVEGDTVKVVRGEYKGIDGKVAQVATSSSRVSIEGIKKEKTRGEKFDVFIHSSNLVVTALNEDDKWRMKKLRGESKSVPSTKETKVEEKKEETKTEQKEGKE